MGIQRVSRKPLPQPPKTIYIRPSSGDGAREKYMHFWAWTCMACLAGQDRMFNESDARTAAARHRLFRHGDEVKRDPDFLALEVKYPIITRTTYGV